MKSLLYFSFFLVLVSFNSFSQDTRIDPYLQTVLRSTGDDFVDVYVILKERLNYDDLHSRTYNLPRKEKQREVVRTLREFADTKQASIGAYLAAKVLAGDVKNMQQLWALNGIVFSAPRRVIEEMAANFVEIESIYYDAKFPSEMLIDDEGITKHNSDNNLYFDEALGNQPGLTLIRAPLVWAEGDSGKGVLVANLDGGCDWDHPDLVNNIWNNLGEDFNGNGKTTIWNGTAWVFDPGDVNGIDNDGNGLVDDFIGWNYEDNSNNPMTGASYSHGTATAGIVSGYGTGGTQTGVAPRTKQIIMVPSGEAQYWLAQQYAVDKGADIITSSLSYKWYFSPKPNYPKFREMTDIELAAGVVHSNSTSNDGTNLTSAPIPFNISAPGNSPTSWIHPDQTLIGGLSSVLGAANVVATTDVINSTSPYGPFTWENIQQNNPSYPYLMPMNYRDYPYQTQPGAMGLLKPDVAAPGAGTTSLSPGTGYQSFSGTSGATPHVGGVLALLLEANPLLTVSDLSRIIQVTAIEKGTVGKDNRYGAGRMDAYFAYLKAIEETPVELISFTASQQDQNVILKWNTVSEKNNKGFQVERREFVETIPFTPVWQTIGFVKGAGTTLDLKKYSFSDQLPEPGKYYYRLRQIDFNGEENFTNEVFVDVKPAGTFFLGQNYPNPFNPSTKIKFSVNFRANNSGHVSLKIYDLLGTEVADLFNEEVLAGSYEVEFTGEHLSSGVYFYRLQADGLTELKKMIYLK